MGAAAQRYHWQPGAVAANTTFSLPAQFPSIGNIVHAEIWRYDHSHVAFTVTTTAGSVTAPVEIVPGSGTQLATIASVGTAAAPGANENALTSTESAIPAVVATTATRESNTTLQSSVAIEANDIFVLDYQAVGRASVLA